MRKVSTGAPSLYIPKSSATENSSRRLLSSLLPLLISAVTAATVSYIVTGTDAMFKFHLDQAFELERIPYVIMLGIFCGLVSLYFTRAMNSVEGVFGRLRTPYKKLIMGGAMLSILIFLFPPLYGEGYDTIELLLNGMSNAEWDTVMNNSFFYGHGNLLLIYLILIILFKQWIRLTFIIRNFIIIIFGSKR